MNDGIAPLRALKWDGCALSAFARSGAALQLLLDGTHFLNWPGQADGRHAQAFSYAPGGDSRMQIQVCNAGVPLHEPLEARWGEPGLRAVSASPPPLQMPDPHSEQYLLGNQAVAAGRAPATVIIVPVYNAGVAVARCLAALREHTSAGATVLLIDDASTDPAVQPLLTMAAAWPNVRVLSNARNLGFTGTVNRGLSECAADADVVLLNADTEVGPGWLGALRRAAYADADHATATAVSDNAGAFSVPELEQHNPLPGRWGYAEAARSLLQNAGLAYPRLPTGNGFCMFIRHDARVQVGALDAAAFPAGYGEENDWCQRAEKLGWQHVIAGNVFVGHARSQSFGEARRLELGVKGMQVLRQRYPDYEAKVGASLFAFPRLVLNWRVRRLWQQAGAAPRPRVLLYEPAHAHHWASWEAWRLYHDGSNLRLLDASACEREMRPARAGMDAIAAWLQRYGFEAICAAKNDGIASLCADLGVPLARTPAELRWAFR